MNLKKHNFQEQALNSHLLSNWMIFQIDFEETKKKKKKKKEPAIGRRDGGRGSDPESMLGKTGI